MRQPDTLDSMSNREILSFLFESGKIDLNKGDLFRRQDLTSQTDVDWDRIEGMMLGLAIGDSLGNTSEGMLPSQRRKSYGEIRDYLPNRHWGNEAKGFPSDDTQLAFWTLEQMVEDHGFVPGHVAKRFCSGTIFGIGSTVRTFTFQYKLGKPWQECGPKSAGNGALMRIAPMIIPHLKNSTADLWVDTALSAMMTHNDSSSIAACLAFVYMLRQLISMDKPPQPYWWLETFVTIAKDLECDDGYKPRGGAYVDYRGPLWRFVEEKVGQAYDSGISVLDACNLWFSGAYLFETVPSVIYTLMKHAHDPEEAIIRAVNDTVDNDTIAAIVGFAVGALHGRKKIPERWLTNLAGRTTREDDGKVFTILHQARQIFGGNI